MPDINIDYTLCNYCRGYEYTDIDGCVSTRIKHGVARMAPNCRCDCHADQVVTKTSFDVTMTVTVDIVEAFLRWCEENEYTQADFDPDGMGDDAFGDGEALAEWLSEQLLDDCGGDITGPGVLAYQSDVDGFEFDPLSGVDHSKLLRLAVPKLPRDPDAMPIDGSDLGMEPLFNIEDVEGP